MAYVNNFNQELPKENYLIYECNLWGSKLYEPD